MMIRISMLYKLGFIWAVSIGKTAKQPNTLVHLTN